MIQIRKYPRTWHLDGSRNQPGNAPFAAQDMKEMLACHAILEEKLDGANCAVSFSEDGELRLQSRGHFLTGGPREVHFELLKAWAGRYRNELYQLLGSRYVMYGEWLYAKHTIFYTDLPHYFMEFDILDQETNRFLDTPSRHRMLAHCNFVSSVPIVKEGSLNDLGDLHQYIGRSHYVNEGHLLRLRELAERQGLRADQILRETDSSPLMEGLYIKLERDGEVKGRFKFVREGFLKSVTESESHWLDRPIVPNQLKPGTDLFA